MLGEESEGGGSVGAVAAAGGGEYEPGFWNKTVPDNTSPLPLDSPGMVSMEITQPVVLEERLQQAQQPALLPEEQGEEELGPEAHAWAAAAGGPGEVTAGLPSLGALAEADEVYAEELAAQQQQQPAAAGGWGGVAAADVTLNLTHNITSGIPGLSSLIAEDEEGDAAGGGPEAEVEEATAGMDLTVAAGGGVAMAGGGRRACCGAGCEAVARQKQGAGRLHVRVLPSHLPPESQHAPHLLQGACWSMRLRRLARRRTQASSRRSLRRCQRRCQTRRLLALGGAAAPGSWRSTARCRSTSGALRLAARTRWTSTWSCTVGRRGLAGAGGAAPIAGRGWQLICVRGMKQELRIFWHCSSLRRPRRAERRHAAHLLFSPRTSSSVLVQLSKCVASVLQAA